MGSMSARSKVCHAHPGEKKKKRREKRRGNAATHTLLYNERREEEGLGSVVLQCNCRLLFMCYITREFCCYCCMLWLGYCVRKENVRRYTLQKYARVTTRRVYCLFCVLGVLLEMGSTADVVDLALKMHCDPAHVTDIQPPFK